MNPTEIRATLAELGGGANKHLGQHFLIDETTLNEIVETADITQGDRVLEVGPGLGVLTQALIESNANITVIERDRRFFDFISPLLKNSGGTSVFGDASKLDWDKVMGEKPWKFVSNLPYSITSLALRKAIYANNPPSIVVVLIQREVAERILMRDGKMSLLALMVALSVGPMKTSSDDASDKKIQIIRRVPPGAFWPPPRVESAVLMIAPTSNAQRRKQWGIEPEDVMVVAKKGFAHPRKLLFRNLGLDENVWTETAQKIGVDIKTRAEELSVGQWVELAKSIS